jgi:hypothetical protein
MKIPKIVAIMRAEAANILTLEGGALKTGIGGAARACWE